MQLISPRLGDNAHLTTRQPAHLGRVLAGMQSEFLDGIRIGIHVRYAVLHKHVEEAVQQVYI